MIIRQVNVKGFRTFDEEVTVPGENEVFSSDINLISGGNETGKSSLMMAMVRALFDDYDTGGAQIERIRPWGTSLSPTIQVEFDVDGTIYRIEKRFLDEQTSQLEAKEDDESSFSPIADGTDADEEVRELFEGGSSRGPSDPSDWGIARALYLRQDMELFEEDEDLTEVTDHLGDEEVRIALSPLEEQITRAVEELKNSYFTSRTEKYTTKDGSAGERVQDLQHDLEQARDELEELKGNEEEAQKLRKQITKLQKNIRSNEERIEAYEETIDELEERLDDVEELREQKEELVEQKDALDEERDELQEDQEELQSLNDSITESEKELTKLQDKIEAQDQRVEELEEKREDIESQIEEKQRDLENVSNQLETERKRKEAIQRNEEVQDLTERLDGLSELDEEEEKLQEKLSGRPVPSEEDVDELRKINNERRNKKAELDSVGLSVELNAETDWTISIGSSPEQTDEVSLGEGDEIKKNFDNRVVIEIPDAGRIDVSSQAGEIQELAEEINELEEERNELHDRFSVEDIDELYDWKSTAEQTQQELEDLEEERDEILDDHESEEELETERNEASNKLDRLLRELDEEQDELPEEVTELDDLRNQKENLEEEIKDLREEKEEIQEKLEDVREERGEKKENKSEMEAKKEEQEKKRDQLLEEHESPDKLAERIEETQEKLEDVNDEFEEVREKLPEEDEDPETKIEDHEAKIDDLKNENQDHEKEITRIKTKLEEVHDEGLSGKINRKEEQIQHLEQQVQSERSKARGMKFLNKILVAHREKRVSNFVRPLKEQVNKYFRRITGNEEREVILNEKLSPAKLKISAEEEPRAFDDMDEHRALSGGAREQLLLSLRMAAANQMSDDEPHFLILDDILGDTDPERHEQILQLLEEEAERLQIFILTSTPNRFRDLESKKIDLERLKLGLGE